MAASNDTTRWERDEIGALSLPAQALYGIHSARALNGLSFSGRSLGGQPLYVHALATVKHAAASANRRAGVLSFELAAPIERAAQALSAGADAEHFPVDLLGGGGSIGVNMNINEVLANLANEALGGSRGIYDPIDPKRHVNASQSTADVCHTALRLAGLAAAEPLRSALAAVVAALEAKRDAFASVRTLARTCLQDAMPTTLGLLFGGYAALLARRNRDFESALPLLSEVSLGGTVIGDGSGAPRAYRDCIVPILAEIAGRPLRARASAADALQNSDDIAQLSAQLALLAQALIKLAHDLRLLASGPRGGFAEIILPHVVAGSSFFAAKRNPVIPETILQCGFQVLGCDRSVQAAVEHGELYLNVFDGLAAINVLDSMQMLTGALQHLETQCLQGLRADQERCAELAAIKS